MTTLDTMTEQQVRSLRAEAAAAGDRQMVDMADYALDNWFYKAVPTRTAERSAYICLLAIRYAEATGSHRLISDEDTA